MASAGGLNAEMIRFKLSLEDGASENVVLKRQKEAGLPKGKELGTSRECLFYQELASAINADLPKVLWSFGDMETGEKAILMEDLSDAVQAGLFFGPKVPINLGKDLAAETAGFNESPASITALAYSAAARLHATYWRPEDLLGKRWLRGAAWRLGEDQENWQAVQDQAINYWKNVPQAVMDIGWDPRLVACLEASLSKVDWNTYQQELKARPWSLVHGDFHPGNMMIRQPEVPGGPGRLVILDWEMVGVGSGVQELSQFLISHCDPDIREGLEKTALRAYYEELTSLCPAAARDMTWDDCWKEYVQGGVGRWLWFMPLLACLCPPPMVKRFHDNVLAFIVSHDITPENVPMPRV